MIRMKMSKKMIMHFFIVLLLVFMGHTAKAALKPYAEYIGKPGRTITDDRKNTDEYVYDTLTKQLFIFDYKFLNVFIFNDTIFKIIVINDGSLFDEPCTIDTIYEDKLLLQKFEQYYTKKYQVKPDYQTAPMGLVKLTQEFGIACGPSGKPTALGARYLILSDKANYSSEEVKRLLLSFDPNDRLIGVLLYNKKPVQELAPVAQVILNSTFTFHYCHGCEPSMKPTRTAKEISSAVERIGK